MKNRQYIALLLLAIMLFTLPACDDSTSSDGDTGLEEKFAFSLPDGGKIQYRSFANVGFDFREYIVVVYADTQELGKLNWTDLSDKDIYQFKGAVLEHNNRLAVDDSEPIPDEYLPDYTSAKKIFLNDPDPIGKMKGLLLFDPSQKCVYICIIKT